LIGQFLLVLDMFLKPVLLFSLSTFHLLPHLLLFTLTFRRTRIEWRDAFNSFERLDLVDFSASHASVRHDIFVPKLSVKRIRYRLRQILLYWGSGIAQWYSAGWSEKSTRH